jgi:exopolysaccharide production protein ExoZ
VISGFVIWTQAVRPDATPGAFLWRRLTRVAPAYWLVTSVVIILAGLWPRLLPEVALAPGHILLSLAFVPHADPLGRVFPVLPPGWTLTYEAAFYGLAAATLLAPRKLRLALILAALGGLSVLGLALPPLYPLGANPMLLQFAAGVWLAHRQGGGKRLPPGAGAVFAALGVALLAAMWLAGVQDILLRPLLWGLPALMIVAGALAVEPVRALTPPRSLIRLGDASYAIYLCHLPTVALSAWIVGARPAWMFAPVAILASIIAGLAFHHAVERPLIAVCRAIPGRPVAARSRPKEKVVRDGLFIIGRTDFR